MDDHHRFVSADKHIERMLPKVLGDPCRVTQSYGRLTDRKQSFEEIVHGRITRRTRENSFTASDKQTNHFHDRGRLASARRTVNDCQIIGRQRMAYRLMLRWV